MKNLKRRLAGLIVLVLVLTTCLNAVAGSYSVKWTASPEGNWQAIKNGSVLKNTWVLDDECDVAGGIYYLVDENGNLVTDKLIVDSHGHYFTFNDQHDGHYGAMITKDGTYWGVALKFSQVHDGSFGSILNQDGIDALKKVYGLRTFPNLSNANSVTLSQGTTYYSSGSGGGYTPTPTPVKTTWTVDFDLNTGVGDIPSQEIVKNGKVASPSNAPTHPEGKTFAGWYQTPAEAAECIDSNRWDFNVDKVTDDMTLIAGWKTEKVTVTYESTDSSAEGMPNPLTVELTRGNALVKPASPSVASKKFTGWFQDEDGTYSWNFDNAVLKDLTLYAFFAENEATIYDVTFDMQGIGSEVGTQKVEKDALAQLPNPEPAVKGYAFLGWYQEKECINAYDFSTPVTKNITIYAKWLKKQEGVITPTINNKDDIATSTVDFNTTDTEVIVKASIPSTAAKALIPSVVGEHTVDETTDKVETELTLDVVLQAAEVTDNSVVYDISLSQTSIVKDVASGTVIDKDDEPVAISDAKDLVTAELTIGKYLENVAVTHSGKTMETLASAAANPANYTVGGYYYEPATGKLTIKSQTFSPFQITFEAAKEEVDVHKVTFNMNGHGTSYSAATVPDGELVEEPAKPEAAGYTFTGWYKEASCETVWDFSVDTITEDVTLYAGWAESENTAYTVEHKKQNIAGDGYEVADTETKTGKTGASVTPAVKTYDGFTAPETQTVTIKGDGSTKVEYLYTRNSYKITYNMNGHGEAIAQTEAKYEAMVSAPTDPTAVGYTFGNWYTDEACTREYTFDTMPAENVTVYAKWIPGTGTKYTIVHKQQNINDDEYTVKDTETKAGETGKSVTPAVKTYDGFTAPEPQTVTIKADGTTEVVYLYDRKSYKIVLDMNDKATDGEIEAKYEANVTKPVDPKADRFTFGGWYTDSACTAGNEYTFATMPLNGKTVYAKWIFKGDGTAEYPYQIYSKEEMQEITQRYDEGFKYYKIADGVTTMDCTGWTPVYLNGSFDGNGICFTNVTACLFQNVGYQLENNDCTLKNFSATMNVSAPQQYGAAALIKNIFNSGTTTFDSVDVHGTIEGYWNIGSYYNYGTANYDDKGCDYTVSFVNCKSDASLICTSGNTCGGMLGHTYEGSGNSVTLNFDDKSAYTGTIFTTNGSGGKYFAITSEYYNENNHFIFNGKEDTFDNGSTKNDYSKTVKITAEVPVVGDSGYTVKAATNVAKILVAVTAQLDAYDSSNKEIPNLSGITMALGSQTISENLTDNVIVFGKVTSAKIKNEADSYGYSLENGELTMKVAQKGANYRTGTARLTVTQYDAEGNILCCGTTNLYTISKN